MEEAELTIAAVVMRLSATTPAIILSIGGLLLLLAAAALAYRAIRLLSGTRTGGTVVGWHKRTIDKVSSYAPIFRYRAENGEEHEVQSSTVWRSEPGDHHYPVTVLYDPKNAERADIADEHRPWRPVIAFLALSATVFVVAWKTGG